MSSLKFTTTTAKATASATDEVYVYQPIEGQIISDFAFGSSSAQTVTISFWVKSSLTGTFSGMLRTSDAGSPPAYRSYIFNYTINTANTWEQKAISIAGDTSTVFTVHTGVSQGLCVLFDLGSGSNYEQTAGSWQTANKYRSSGSVRTIGTASATWQVTGVQLEPGPVATPFERRPFTTEIGLCQRYYLTTTASVRGYASGAGQFFSNAAYFPVNMRATPSSVSFLAGGGSTSNASVSLVAPSSIGVRHEISSSAAGDTYSIDRTIIANAEL